MSRQANNNSTQTHGRAHLDARRTLGLAAKTDGRFTAPLGASMTRTPDGQIITCPNYNCRTEFAVRDGLNVFGVAGWPTCMTPTGDPQC